MNITSLNEPLPLLFTQSSKQMTINFYEEQVGSKWLVWPSMDNNLHCLDKTPREDVYTSNINLEEKYMFAASC